MSDDSISIETIQNIEKKRSELIISLIKSFFRKLFMSMVFSFFIVGLFFLNILKK